MVFVYSRGKSNLHANFFIEILGFLSLTIKKLKNRGVSHFVLLSIIKKLVFGYWRESNFHCNVFILTLVEEVTLKMKL